ncbi:MAG: acyltransferase family protein [Ghiorsea sp.]|nr:acyltransferase family protein [Ghiorsea sp.]
MARIITPILFWSFFFAFIWGALKSMIGGAELRLDTALSAIISGQPYYHMWFLYMIIGLYFITPYLRMIVAQASVSELSLLTGGLFILAAINGAEAVYFTQPFTNWFLMYIPYFFAGYLIRHSQYNPPKLFLWTGLLTSALFSSLGSYFFASGYFYGYLSVTTISMSIAVMYLLKLWQAPLFSANIAKSLASLSFGVYLIHPVILEVIHYHGHESIQFHPALSIPALASVTFLISLIGAWFIYKLPFIKRII